MRQIILGCYDVNTNSFVYDTYFVGAKNTLVKSKNAQPNEVSLDFMNNLTNDPAFQAAMKDPLKGARLFFRKACLDMRSRFEKMYDHSDMPRVFLHGNPHHDNFAGFPNGCGLIDFDRSVIGSYGWDIVRFYSAIILWSEGFDLRSFSLDPNLVQAFITSYLESFERPDQALYQGELFLFDSSLDEDGDLAAYLQSKKKWAKGLLPLSEIQDFDMARALLEGCLDNFCFAAYKKGNYKWSHYHCKQGTMGNNHHIFLLQQVKNEEKFKLVDVKSTYTNPDSQNYFSPFNHEGMRMIFASKLYAPKLEPDIGYVTYKGKDYWARLIRPNKKKVKAGLSREDHLEVCRTIGSQLGNGHRRSLFAAKPSVLTKHLDLNSEIFKNIAIGLIEELLENYLKLLKVN